jgi:hypothetical protein
MHHSQILSDERHLALHHLVYKECPTSSFFPPNHHHLGITLGILATPRLVVLHSNVLPEIQTTYTRQPFQKAHLDIMSNDPKAFDADIATGDPSLFAPLLQEDLTKLPPPFTICNPLLPSDFPEETEVDGHSTFLSNLQSLVDYFEQGYNDNLDRDIGLTISSSQFIRRAAQLVTAIMAGIRSTFPLADSPQFLRQLGPNKLESLKVFAEAVRSLNRYLTDPLAHDPSGWQQCLRCLKVAHISITEDDWWAQFATANQHAATARASILNATIRNFSREALLRMNKEREKAWDKIVSRTVSANPPPFDTDPHILEWIDHEAHRLKADTEARALHKAEQHTMTLFKQQKLIIKARLEEDLTLLRDETDNALDLTREQAKQELIDLKAKHKAQRATAKTDLQDENLRAARKERTTRQKKRPNPLTSAMRSRSSSIAPPTPIPMEMADDLPLPSEYQLPSEAAQDILMITEAQDGNLPTPKADIPLAPPNLNSNKPILDMLTMIQKQLECSETHLAALENPPTQPSWDTTMADPQNEDGYLHGAIDDIDYMHPTPEQLELLQQREEMEYAMYYASLDAQEQQQMDEEEHQAQTWKLMTPDKQAKATLATGGSEEQAAVQCSTPSYTGPPTGTVANPIPIPSTQSSRPAIHMGPSRVPISHLVPDQGRNPIPGLVWRPNPQQQTALPPIGGLSYASTAARRPQRTNPTLTRPSTAPTTTLP